MGIRPLQFTAMLCLNVSRYSSSCLVFACLSDHSSSLHFYWGANIDPLKNLGALAKLWEDTSSLLVWCYVPCAVLIQATWRHLSLPGKFSMMCFTKYLADQNLLVESTFSSTRSPACMLLVSLVHLFPVWPILEEIGTQVPSHNYC